MNRSLNLYTVYIHSVLKKIKCIINYFLKTDYQIPKNFGTNISDTTGHQTTIQSLISHNFYAQNSYCFSVS